MKASRLFLAVFSTVSAIGLAGVALAQNTSSTNTGTNAVSPAPGTATNGAPSTRNTNAPNNSDEGTTNGRAGAPSTPDSAMSTTERAPKPDRN